MSAAIGMPANPIHQLGSNPQVKKVTNALKIAFLVNMLLGLITASIYIYLGSVGDNFPSWGGPLLITMGSLSLVSTLMTSCIVPLAIGMVKRIAKNYLQKFMSPISTHAGGGDDGADGAVGYGGAAGGGGSGDAVGGGGSGGSVARRGRTPQTTRARAPHTSHIGYTGQSFSLDRSQDA